MKHNQMLFNIGPWIWWTRW